MALSNSQSDTTLSKGLRPSWFKVPLPTHSPQLLKLLDTTRKAGLATVCQEARCPNLGECWASGTVTLMLMGDTCTRHCQFCAVATARKLPPLDTEEPEKVAALVAEAGWGYVVLTSVDRDDLPDQGAAHFAATIQAIHQRDASIKVEALIPDFRGDESLLDTVLEARPQVLAHNLETVERLNPLVRDRRAGYQQSLRVLQAAKERLSADAFVKSSLMLGLGESESEIRQALSDLCTAGVELLTLGQYLQPTPKHWPVAAYLPPEQFAYWKEVAEQEYGFAYCASGPLVRSSYKALEAFVACKAER